MNIQTLKKSSADLARLTAAIENMNSNASSKDDRFWYPETDAAGNAYAIIRFLPGPAVDGDDALPFVRLFTHGFKGPGGWYIENSRTTIGEADPVSEYNSQLWNASQDDNSPQRKQARNQKRRLNYISNILVISDPKNPENDGKVFLFKYGKKLFDKVSRAMNPEFEDEKKFNPFDPWEGANFRLKIRRVDDYPNYEASAFDTPSALQMSDQEIESLWKSEYSLKELIDPSQFKSYDELKERLNRALGDQRQPNRNSPKVGTSKKPVPQDEDDELFDDDDDEMMRRFDALAND